METCQETVTYGSIFLHLSQMRPFFEEIHHLHHKFGLDSIRYGSFFFLLFLNQKLFYFSLFISFYC